MNIGKLTAVAALALGLGTASALAASVPALEPTNGENGIGIDISTAGSSPASVGQFLAGLAPETQHLVLTGCETAVANPVGYKQDVVTFCENALGTGARVGALGFAEQAPLVEPGIMSNVGAY